jgi:hypothetical protein
MMNEPIGTINGSWWLLQMWLNLHLQRVAINDIKTLSFPSLNHSEAQDKKTKSGRQILPMPIF